VEQRNARTYELTARVALPFHCNAAPVDISAVLPGDDFTTYVKLEYSEKVELLPGKGYSISLGPCTLIEIVRELRHELAEDQLRTWLMENHSRIVNESILPALNHFLMHLKLAHSSQFGASVVRTVGEIDLLFANLFLNGETASVRVTQSFASAINFPPQFKDVRVDISSPLPNEVRLLARAVDLANGGYRSEAFVVGFALLDDLLQSFLCDRLPHLDQEAAGRLLRRIESSRLSTFLGPVLKMATGCSLMENEALAAEVKWLNQKRNEIMHSGADCKLDEAKRGLDAVLGILQQLRDLGAPYELPADLAFWSE